MVLLMAIRIYPRSIVLVKIEFKLLLEWSFGLIPYRLREQK